MSDEQKKPAGKWSQAVITFETIIYSIAVFLLCIPVYAGLYVYRAIVYLIFTIPTIFVWIIETFVLPILYYIYHAGYFVLKYIVIALETICAALRAVYVTLRDWWRKINWCAVRSGIRILAIIGIIGAIYTIIEGVMQLPPDTTIITGRFFDSNGTVFRVHEAIALLMFSITAFYNAWAYSKDEEVSFICSHTLGVSTLCKIRDKVKRK
jgi:hypothetical protein